MIETVDIINFCIITAGLVISIIGFLIGAFLPYIENKIRWFFVVFFTLLFLYVGSQFITHISLTLLGPDFSLLSKLAMFCESLFSSMMMPIFTIYMLSSAGLSWRRSPYLYLTVCIWVVYVLLLLSTCVSKTIYYITPNNIYHRGPLYPIILMPPVLLMLIDLIILIRYKKALPAIRAKAFSLYIIIPILSILIQMFFYGLLTIEIGTSIAAIIMLVMIMVEQVNHHIYIEQRNTRVYAENLALQMRPHFVYNVLMSIYYLIDQDQNKARQVILDFNTYLRKNFSAIAAEYLIPFSDELTHVQAYLAVEQVRFEDILSVEFDTPHTQFKLPPLTIQPIVENAVKHGVDPDLGPMHLSIRTRNTEDGSLVIIEDDGRSFGTHTNDDPHIALDNIRERLKSTCNGTINVYTIIYLNEHNTYRIICLRSFSLN